MKGTENPRVPSSILGLGTNQIKGLINILINPFFFHATLMIPFSFCRRRVDGTKDFESYHSLLSVPGPVLYPKGYPGRFSSSLLIRHPIFSF